MRCSPQYRHDVLLATERSTTVRQEMDGKRRCTMSKVDLELEVIDGMMATDGMTSDHLINVSERGARG
jgi:hypothetical protein